MKALLIVFVLVVTAVVGLGFYRGWFQVSSDSADGNPNITFSADPDKVQDDKKPQQEKMQSLGGQVKDKAAVPSGKSMEGKVVSVNGDKLTMTNKEGKEHSHTLAANVKMTCDGKTCTAADLKAGMRIRVTTDTADRHAAVRIEALDKDAAFASQEARWVAEGQEAVETYLRDHPAALVQPDTTLAVRFGAFEGMMGDGYEYPTWNIQGYHYLTAHRVGQFSKGKVPVRIYVAEGSQTNPSATGPVVEPKLT